ncbi:polyphosphate:nucleotide phosphotransferase, PPK2 family [Calidithermus terrae]|uniref:Polyphosphate:nucleotide phosphotransferase, PPK2 family n=1 Tax=Calidithermus terrae TaxID=1408545 RepID=A0A399EM18_9DEIN|nr:AMP/ADP-polyphosphate phosphotransferase [Calidithermus terrae]RIH83492.1 polyphosphate:nucleotide phosphotransferase, PPK2 family [Calidithermus terrae]
MKSYRVLKDGKFKLSRFDPDDTSEFKGGKEEALVETGQLRARLEHLQELLYAQKKHKLLVVLQAVDAGGKDGTVRVVFDGVNPTGVRVVSFGEPTEHELARDYLWRVHRHVPARGEITIFNRSHYEDVVAARVKGLVPKKVWRRRYRHIREFERMLTDEGVTLLKFFLHISKDEQRQRLQERLDDPRKRWKFRRSDLEDRARWDDYQAAYEDAIGETSTGYAPWHVIPANRNWYRNWAVSKVIVETLEGLGMKYPEPEEGLAGLKVE